MKVTLLDSIFEHCTDDVALIEVLQTGYERRHIVVSDSDTSTTAVQRWLSRQSEQTRLTCEMAIEDGLLRDTAENMRLRISIDDRRPNDDNWTTMFLSLESARQLLRRPLNVWFENDLNDGQFLLATAKPEVRDRLIEWKGRGWIQFQHAGGIGSIPERATKLMPPLTLRTIFLFDSDARLPMVLSTPSEQAVQSCRANSVTYHCLERRAIENYIPPGTLKAWFLMSDLRGREKKRVQHAIEAFGRLSRIQRSHFNLKRGFDGDSKSSAMNWPRADVRKLWEGVPESDLSKLKQGIDPRIAQKVFGTGAISYGLLVNDNSNTELDMIAQLLIEGV